MKAPILAPVLSALALTCAVPALAQQIEPPEIAANGTVLSVTGEGQSAREPDIAMFSAGVATTGTTAGEALSANSTAMNRVIKALKAAGIADKDIQTSNLNVNPVYGDRTRLPGNTLEDQLPKIVGYRASNQVMVKQRKIGEFGKVIDTLVSAGANQVNGPNFQMDEPDDALNEARRKALADAREKAQLYASAAGLKVSRIISIAESGGYGRPPIAYARVANMDMAESTPIAAGEVELTASVQVMFELTP